MKRMSLVLIIFSLLIPGFALGQEEEEIITFDPYAGWLYGTGHEEEHFLDTRVGGKARLTLSENWRVSGYSVWFADEGWRANRVNLNGLSLTYESGKVEITGGKIATVTTRERPHPATASGQFEMRPHQLMPGSAYGVLVRYSSLSVSVTERDGGLNFMLGMISGIPEVISGTGRIPKDLPSLAPSAL